MKYKTETIEISDDSLDKELNRIAEDGWRFIGFVPKTFFTRGRCFDDVHKFATAIFEKEEYKDKMACGMP